MAKVDPAFELTFLLSSKTPSYSLLDDGTVMEICYSWNENLTSRNDLIVESKKVVSKGILHLKMADVASKVRPARQWRMFAVDSGLIQLFPLG